MLIYNDKTITDSNIIKYVEVKPTVTPFIYTNDLRFYPAQGFISSQTTHLSFGIQPMYMNERQINGDRVFDVIHLDPEFGVKTSISGIYDEKAEQYVVESVDVTSTVTDYTSYVVESLSVYDATINIFSPTIAEDSTDYAKYVAISNKYNKPARQFFFVSSINQGKIFTINEYMTNTLTNHCGLFFHAIEHPETVGDPYSQDNFSTSGGDTCFIALPGNNVLYTLDNVFYNLVESSGISYLDPALFQPSWEVVAEVESDEDPEELDYIHSEEIEENPWKIDQTDSVADYGTPTEQRVINYSKFDYTYTFTKIESLEDDIGTVIIVGGYQANVGNVANTVQYGMITKIYRNIDDFFVILRHVEIVGKWCFSAWDSSYKVSEHNRLAKTWINRTAAQTMYNNLNGLIFGSEIHLLGGYSDTAMGTESATTLKFDTSTYATSTGTARTLHSVNGHKYLYGQLLIETSNINKYDPTLESWEYIRCGIETVTEGIGPIIYTEGWRKLNNVTFALSTIQSPASRSASGGSSGIYNDKFVKFFGNTGTLSGHMYVTSTQSWITSEQLPINAYYGVDRW